MPKLFSRFEMDALSQTLRDFLDSRGMSGRQLSSRLGAAHSTISLILVGQRQLSYFEFLQVCDSLSIDESEFIAAYRRNLEALGSVSDE